MIIALDKNQSFSKMCGRNLELESLDRKQVPEKYLTYNLAEYGALYMADICNCFDIHI